MFRFFCFTKKSVACFAAPPLRKKVCCAIFFASFFHYNSLGGTRTQCGCERSSAWAAQPPIFLLCKKISHPLRHASSSRKILRCNLFREAFLCRWHIFSEQQRDGSLKGVELAAFQRNAGRPSKRAIVGASASERAPPPPIFCYAKNQSTVSLFLLFRKKACCAIFFASFFILESAWRESNSCGV